MQALGFLHNRTRVEVGVLLQYLVKVSMVVGDDGDDDNEEEEEEEEEDGDDDDDDDGGGDDDDTRLAPLHRTRVDVGVLRQ
jgi:hypothetical protein